MSILQDFFHGELLPWEHFGSSNDPTHKMYSNKIADLENSLAEKAGISLGFLSQIEAPNMAVGISLATPFSIAEALQVPPSKLLELD